MKLNKILLFILEYSMYGLAGISIIAIVLIILNQTPPLWYLLFLMIFAAPYVIFFFYYIAIQQLFKYKVKGDKLENLKGKVKIEKGKYGLDIYISPELSKYYEILNDEDKSVNLFHIDRAAFKFIDRDKIIQLIKDFEQEVTRK